VPAGDGLLLELARNLRFFVPGVRLLHDTLAEII
jgi:hypothetical protein